MPTQHRRLVRQPPLLERIKNYLDPIDFLLWLSEELESSDWEKFAKDWGLVLGFAINFVMLIARANSASSSDYDDVFGEPKSGLLGWLATLTTYVLTAISLANAFYTFYRKRHYRMFEASVDTTPSTPSAHRVRVDTTTAASSPLRYLSSILSTSAESRAHPDPQKDVWEISIWDPTPLCLKTFCLFSPGHVLIYWLLLPASQDTRPSVTVVLTITLITVLSLQLHYLQFNFSQQSKDTSLIHKEVLNEYDIKYVHPRTRPVTRDAAVQCRDLGSTIGIASEVDLYSPVTIIKKGFKTNPNQDYAKHFNPDALDDRTSLKQRPADLNTPPNFRQAVDRTPARQVSPSRSSQVRHSMGPRVGDGGSLGVYSHERSPLKKASSQNLLNQRHSHLSAPRRESGRF